MIWNFIFYWLAWFGFCSVIYQLGRFGFHFCMLFDRNKQCEEKINKMEKTIRDLDQSILKITAEQSGINAVLKELIKNV